MTRTLVEIGKIKKVSIELKPVLAGYHYNIEVVSSIFGEVCVGKYDNLSDAKTKFNEMLELARSEE